MAHYDIFRQQLAVKFPAYGYALWEPSPGEIYPTVQVGDVGFIREGKFRRLFNVLLPADHPSHERFGVPEHHEPLKLNISPHHIDRGILSPNNFRSMGVRGGSVGGGVFSPGPDSEQVSFSCAHTGAVLSLPVPAQWQDTLARGDFGKWIITHINLWFAFTRRLGLGITRMEDILLVTGCHLARSFANVAFLEDREEEQVTFEVRVSGISNVEWRFPLDDIQGVALNVGPSGQNLPEGQCIFIRGFRATRILGILPKLRGAAEPTQGSNEDEFEPDVDLITTPDESDIKYQDPLNALLEYITMQAPDCDMALVHDDDLKCITDSPEEVIDCLRKSAPQIWQVECAACTSEAEASATKVATLTKYSFGKPTAEENIPLSSGSSSSQEQMDSLDLNEDRKRGRIAVTTRTKDDPIQLPQGSSERDAQAPLISAGLGPCDEDSPVCSKYVLTPLHRASSEGEVEVARTALVCRVDPTARDKNGWTPLHSASSEGQVEMTRALLEGGTYPTVQDNTGSTPLHCASSKGQLEVALVLLEGGADVAARDKFRSTPLHWASSQGQVEVARVLLKGGADVTARNKNGSTPLHLASPEGKVDVTRALLEAGADPTAQDSSGMTPLHSASSEGEIEVVTALLEAGANVAAKNKIGWTALHYASYSGYAELARILLGHGADPKAQDHNGWTPLRLASSNRHRDVNRILLDSR